jgi:hypothetical protein
MPRVDRNPVEQAQPGAKRRRKADRDRQRVLGGDHERLAANLQAVGQHAGRLLVVDRVERKHHVGGREWCAVGELHVRPQVQPERAAVGEQLPPLRKVRLELVRHAVHVDEAAVHQVREHRGREIPRRVTVERARLGADRRDDGAAVARRTRVGVRSPVTDRRHRGDRQHAGDERDGNR